MTELVHADLEPAVHMRRMLYGQLLSRVLCAVAALDIPDLLGDRCVSAKELAAESGADPGVLGQVLRALVPFGVFDEDADGNFRLTAVGATLRSDATASAMPTALLVQGAVGDAWNDFLWTIRTGETSFGRLYGTGFFSRLEEDEELRTIFHKSQQHGLELDLAGILRNLDFSAYRVLVDVGGGDGALLEGVLSEHQHLSGVLLDLPSVVADASLRFAVAGLLDRTEVCGGNFFCEVPGGGDVYLLRQILHDLDDDRCVTLLTNVRRAMGPAATLLIMDIVTDARPAGGLDAEISGLMDLYMMSIFGGRERSREEFKELLDHSGFTLRSIESISGHMSAIHAAPAHYST